MRLSAVRVGLASGGPPSGWETTDVPLRSLALWPAVPGATSACSPRNAILSLCLRVLAELAAGAVGRAVRPRPPRSQVDAVLAGPDYTAMFAPATHTLDLDKAVFAAKFPGWNAGWKIPDQTRGRCRSPATSSASRLRLVTRFLPAPQGATYRAGHGSGPCPDVATGRVRSGAWPGLAVTGSIRVRTAARGQRPPGPARVDPVPTATIRA